MSSKKRRSKEYYLDENQFPFVASPYAQRSLSVARKEEKMPRNENDVKKKGQKISS